MRSREHLEKTPIPRDPKEHEEKSGEETLTGRTIKDTEKEIAETAREIDQILKHLSRPKPEEGEQDHQD